jgi:hypothetical protein
MSYAYFQGQEAQALAYYKKLLEMESDAEARKAIGELLVKLQESLDKAGKNAIPVHEGMHNAVAA